MIEPMPGALAGLRVLDLTDRTGNLAAKMIADLGADVIKIEPLEGDALRRQGPFAAGVPGTERSLTFFVNNLNKRSIALDLDNEEGQDVFRRLAATATALLETKPAGWLDQRGIGYEMLSRANPRLVHTAITAFGQYGPYRDYRSSDFTAQAMGGALYMTGELGEKPVRGAVRVADKMAGYSAATATLIAVFHSNATGQGQFIDISMQEAVLSQMESAAVAYAFTGTIRNRNGRRYPSTTCPAGIYPCRDGWVSIVASKPHQWVGIRDWIGDERLMADEYLIESNRFADRDFIDPIVEAWTVTMGKTELFHGGQRRDVPIGESMRPSDVVRDVHLRSRGYVVPTSHAVLGDVEVPGPPYLYSETPWRVSRPAPLLGQHTDELLSEAGFSHEDVLQLRARGITA